MFLAGCNTQHTQNTAIPGSVDITLVKRADLSGFSPAEMAVIRRFLFEAFDGATPESQAGWRAWWRLLAQAELGEVVGLQTQVARNRRFHAFHMALERRVYEGQEVWTSFEQFRNWLKIGCGWVDWYPGSNGPVPVPRSTNYLSLDEVQMRVLHTSVVHFLRSDVALSSLWPHLEPARGRVMLDTLMKPPERAQAHSPADLLMLALQGAPEQQQQPAAEDARPAESTAANDEPTQAIPRAERMRG